MAGNLQTDLSRMNEFIRNAALKKKPIFDAYKTLSDTQGTLKIDYVDFEWRYYQYYHGNRDLTIAKSSNNSSPVTFSDLPMDVLELIMKKTDLVARFTLRKVSRDLRELADTTEVHCDEITFAFDDVPLATYLGNVNLNDKKTYYGFCCVVTVKPRFKNQRFYTVVIADASTLLKNPKLKIGLMKCALFSQECSEVLKIVNSLNFQLDVQSIYFDACAEFIVPLLQSIKPEALEEIKLEGWTVDNLNSIAETEQWKKAKKLSLEEIRKRFRMEKCLHFEEIRINEFEFTDKNLTMVRDILLKSAHLQSCHLENQVLDHTDYFEMDDYYFEDEEEEREDEDEERIKRIMGEDPAYDSATRRFSIPNSQDCFQLKVEKDHFGIVYGLTITRILYN